MTVHIPEQTSAAAWKLIAEKREAENAKLRAAWIRQIAKENECYAWVHDLDKPCDPVKCGCNLELESYLAE